VGKNFFMTSTILHCVGSAILTSLASVLTVDEYTTFCVFGDGNFIMRMFDLATLNKHARRIMIFLLNHSEYSMIKQTQEQWFGSEYGASNASDGLPFPNFQTLAQSHGFNYHRLDWCNFAMSSKNLEELN
jgi:thiamine pyrophosphate-dependent acetolactate synthase large subunit-like protein